MANLTANAPLRFLGEAVTEKRVLDTSSAQTIYKGEPLVINASVDTVNLVSQAAEALVDGDVFVGIAAEPKSVTLSAAETTEIEVYVEPTIVGFKSAVFTDADSGKTVYMSDTATLSASNGAYAEIGKLVRVMDGYAYVKLSTPKVLNVP